MTEPLDNAVVVYGVKELLAEIRDDVKDSKRMLDGKADKADLVAVEARMGAIEQFKWKLVGFVLGASAVGGGGAATLFRVIGG